MTKITFFRKNGVFWGFRETGHTGFGEEGDDILCSALSAMTMLILNTLEVAYKCPVDYRIDERTTDITVKCRSALPEYEKDEKKRFAASGLIEGYYYQLNDLVEEYYEFLEVKTEEK
ncbi:MAG: ribosomal-processing cysteine protease Prp [Clostridia bacterium]|nr:ribosomal-processing cysteine protease Prp [Clostridia bacterium]MBP3293615.1 ribosomal-processing cysteine protease Prp [Clostridia bacterium]